MNPKDYPCHPDNDLHKYYKGKNSIIQNGECKKCEWSKWMGYFIEYLRKQGRCYALEKCADVDDSSTSQPEAVFVDLNNKDEKMILEIKELREVYRSSEEKRAREYIENKFMNKIFCNLLTRIVEFMVRKEKDDLFKNFLDKGNKDEIISIHELMQAIEKYKEGNSEEFFLELFGIFGVGIKVCMYTNKDNCIRTSSGVEFATRKAVTEVIWEHNDKNRLVKQIADEIAEYIINNILSAMYRQIALFRQTKEFEIDNICFEVGKSIENDSPFYLNWTEVGGISQFYNTSGYIEEAERLYKKCEKKFTKDEYKGYKRIFLLVNANSKNDETIIGEVLKHIEKPPYIDEIWLLANDIKEEWDEDIEDIKERVIGVKCICVDS